LAGRLGYKGLSAALLKLSLHLSTLNSQLNTFFRKYVVGASSTRNPSFIASFSSINIIHQHHPSTSSINIIHQHHPSTSSINIIHQHHPSTSSINIIHQQPIIHGYSIVGHEPPRSLSPLS
jgi:hypothetical protein